MIGIAVVTTLQAGSSQSGWQYYGGDAGGSRYSEAKQINKQNISKLQVAWTFRTGDVSDGTAGMRKNQVRSDPILFNGTLYVSHAVQSVIALDPATGQQKWSYDPKIDLKTRYSESLVSRGVSAWEDTRARAGSACKYRIFLGTLDARLIAIDATSGQVCTTFDLKKGINIADAGQYEVTSPPAIINDIVVVGSAIGDNRQVDVEQGIVRAFDARSGTQRWSWDPIPRSADSAAWKNMDTGRRRQDRRSQCVVHDLCRCRTRSGFCPDRQRGAGLLWRRTSRQQSLREQRRGDPRIDRQSRLALSGRSSRFVGLRRRGAAATHDCQAEWS
jgi:quinoprotein glucose dehydrogenase